MGISIDFLNLLDRRDHNIDYDCASRIDRRWNRHSQMFSSNWSCFRSSVRFTEALEQL